MMPQSTRVERLVQRLFRELENALLRVTVFDLSGAAELAPP
jgi:hypothetical protein